MTVKRIVTNIPTQEVEKIQHFYAELFDLDVVMDHGWLVTLASGQQALTQIGIASEGGSGAPVPDISIEVDDVDEIYRRAQAAGAPIEYELTDEPWQARRFFLRDPAGKLVNVLMHLE